MLTIRIVETEADCIRAQEVFNHKEILPHLGGFTMLQNLKDRTKPGKSASLWLAEAAGVPVGACLVAGRPQSHLLKYGEIGVVPEWRRKRVATSLYAAMTAQAALEGRRLCEDTIVSNNATQHIVLPSFGASLVGELKHRTASGLGICLYQFDLMQFAPWDKLLSRVPKEYRLEVMENHYTEDLWAKNMEIFAKHPDVLGHMDREMQAYRMHIRRDARFSIIQGAPLPHNAGKKRKQTDEPEEVMP